MLTRPRRRRVPNGPIIQSRCPAHHGPGYCTFERMYSKVHKTMRFHVCALVSRPGKLVTAGVNRRVGPRASRDAQLARIRAKVVLLDHVFYTSTTPVPGEDRRWGRDFSGNLIHRDAYRVSPSGANPFQELRGWQLGHIIDDAAGGAPVLENLVAEHRLSNFGLHNCHVVQAAIKEARRHSCPVVSIPAGCGA
jgi:hypothetical protein